MDLALEACGTNGKFQKIIIFATFLSCIINNILNISFPFMVYRPTFLCKEKYNDLVPMLPCRTEDLCKPNEFDYEIDEVNSMDNWAKDYHLYCNRTKYIPMISSFYFFGSMIGTMTLCTYPDSSGRIPVYKYLLMILLFVDINYLINIGAYHLIFIAFLNGITAFLGTLNSLLITEFADRSIAGISMSILNALFPFTGILVSLFFLYINNWRILYGIMLFLCILKAYIVFTFFLESPRWLNSRNKLIETISILKQIARLNGNEARFSEFLAVNNNLINKQTSTLQEISKNYTVMEIISLKSQRTKIIIQSLIWFSISLSFYGLILNIENLGGDIYVDSIVTYGAELVAELLSGWAADVFGRIIVFKFGAICGFCGFFGFELLTIQFYKTMCLFMASFGIAAIFNLVYIYSPESIPTSIRSTSFGLLFFAGRIGAVIAPSLIHNVSSPSYLIAALCAFMYYLCSLLPETLNMPIEDDVPEAKRQFSFLSQTNPKTRKNTYRKTLMSFATRKNTRPSMNSEYYFKMDQNNF